MKKAVIYARYSSDTQTEQSIEGQLRVCQEYAKAHDIVILDTYIDRAMTGTNDNRAAFQQMIKDSAKKEWDFVLVYKLDRFSRDKYATAINKKALKDNGVRLVSATEHIPNTPEGIILESMIEGYAEYYSAELSQKVKRGMNETRRKGNFTGGHLIYGYKIENRKVVIDEESAETVRFIYEQYAIGVYVKDIIKALTEKGIYSNAKPFARNSIYNILKNEKYSGIYRFNE
ncbi:MAG: recombinase family protein, partial [Clostridia bacterium]|nr:recombinase family protein [Clostridia bacterium]